MTDTKYENVFEEQENVFEPFIPDALDGVPRSIHLDRFTIDRFITIESYPAMDEL